MNKTLIDMLTAINEPEAIERAYQIMAAKRDLLAYKDKPAFKHSVMEPKPLVDTHCPDMADIMRTSSVTGEHLIRLKGVTDSMERKGFQNGMVFELLRVGYNMSTLRYVRSDRVVCIHNSYLESFVKPTHPSQLPVQNTNF